MLSEEVVNTLRLLDWQLRLVVQHVVPGLASSGCAVENQRGLDRAVPQLHCKIDLFAVIFVKSNVTDF